MASAVLETPPSTHPVGRPSFHHRCTENRIREGTARPPSFSRLGKISRERKSVFKELGLDTANLQPNEPHSGEQRFGELTGLVSTTNPHASSDSRYQPRTGNGNPNGNGNRRSCDDNDYDDDHNNDYNLPPRRSRTTPPQGSGRLTASASEPGSPTTSDSFLQQQQQQQQQQRPWYSKLTQVRRPRIKTASSAPPSGMSTLTKLSSIALLLAVLLPALGYFRG